MGQVEIKLKKWVRNERCIIKLIRIKTTLDLNQKAEKGIISSVQVLVDIVARYLCQWEEAGTSCISQGAHTLNLTRHLSKNK